MKTLITAAIAALLALAAPLVAAAESLNGRVVSIDVAAKKITIAAVMGHKALRVLNPQLLEVVKVGDQIKFTTGQDGTEVVVTTIEVSK